MRFSFLRFRLFFIPNKLHLKKFGSKWEDANIVEQDEERAGACWEVRNVHTCVDVLRVFVIFVVLFMPHFLA